MNWAAGAMAAGLLALSLLAVTAARHASRARVTAARLHTPHATVPSKQARSFPAPRATAAVVATALGFALGGAGLAALALAAATGAPRVMRTAARKRRDAKREAALPEALEAVARGLRSGASLRLALEEAAVTGGALEADLRRVTAEAAHGADLVGALERWATTTALPGVHLTVSALCLGIEAGGAQARAVDGVAATLRQRQGVAAEAKALGAQARMSGLVIAVAPVVFCGLASTTDARTAQFLLHTATGQLLLAAGLGLDILGALWMARLTRVSA